MGRPVAGDGARLTVHTQKKRYAGAIRTYVPAVWPVRKARPSIGTMILVLA